MGLAVGPRSVGHWSAASPLRALPRPLPRAGTAKQLGHVSQVGRGGSKISNAVVAAHEDALAIIV